MSLIITKLGPIIRSHSLPNPTIANLLSNQIRKINSDSAITTLKKIDSDAMITKFFNSKLFEDADQIRNISDLDTLIEVIDATSVYYNIIIGELPRYIYL